MTNQLTYFRHSMSRLSQLRRNAISMEVTHPMYSQWRPVFDTCLMQVIIFFETIIKSITLRPKQAVMSLVKELDLKTISLVVSDTDQSFDSQFLHMLYISSQNSLNLVSDTTETISSDNQQKQNQKVFHNCLHFFTAKSHNRNFVCECFLM